MNDFPPYKTLRDLLKTAPLPFPPYRASPSDLSQASDDPSSDLSGGPLATMADPLALHDKPSNASTYHQPDLMANSHLLPLQDNTTTAMSP